jgi:Holliday junction resolvase RusA-like endonuclease
MSSRLDFIIEYLPPSVNHYIDHGRGHGKTAEAILFCDRFAIDIRKLKNPQPYVIADRFQVELHFWPGPKGKGDVDNGNKLPLDCCAKAALFRNSRGHILSDAWVKRLKVEIHDEGEERAQGPEMRIIIEPLERRA